MKMLHKSYNKTKELKLKSYTLGIKPSETKREGIYKKSDKKT